MSETSGHTPVLLSAVLEALNIRIGGAYLDATFGRGGHAGALLDKLIGGRLLCLDRDPQAVDEARKRFAGNARVSVFLAPFSALAVCADAVQPGLKFDGILFDLGVSSPQLDDATRGFSFMQDGPLDMRMNRAEGLSAAEVVNTASETELIRIFREFGEEPQAPRIARAIVADRALHPFERTLQLANMIARVARVKPKAGTKASSASRSASGRTPRKHPATRVFQALRIHVNRELEELETGLAAAFERLAPSGRLAVISFHSLEDRIVKQFLRRHATTDPVYAGLPFVPSHAQPTLRLLGKSIEAPATEIARNPRARSARLRVAERLSVERAA